MAEVLYSIAGVKPGWAHAVRPDGHVWGRGEGPPNFIVVKFPGVSVADCEHFVEDDPVDPGKRRWRIDTSLLPFAVRQLIASDDFIEVGGGGAQISWNELELAVLDDSASPPGRPAGLPAHSDRFRTPTGASLSSLMSFRANEFAANAARRAAFNELDRLISHGGTPTEIAAAQATAQSANAAWQAEKQNNGTLSNRPNPRGR